jgi:hypothetical protein
VIEQEAILVSLLSVTVEVALTLAVRFAGMCMTSLIVQIEPRWILVALGWISRQPCQRSLPGLRAVRQHTVDALRYE